MRQKSSIRSFTNTALRKLSIGPTRWLVLLIELGAASVLVSYDCDVSRGGNFQFAFMLFFLLLLSFIRLTLFRCSAMKLKNSPVLFSLMKTRKRQDKSKVGKGKKNTNGIKNEAHE